MLHPRTRLHILIRQVALLIVPVDVRLVIITAGFGQRLLGQVGGRVLNLVHNLVQDQRLVTAQIRDH